MVQRNLKLDVLITYPQGHENLEKGFNNLYAAQENVQKLSNPFSSLFSLSIVLRGCIPE